MSELDVIVDAVNSVMNRNPDIWHKSTQNYCKCQLNYWHF
jgi:hypothetical protein